jgi:hypothetical protein
MKPGDLVKFDMPGDPHRGTVGVVIGKRRRKGRDGWSPYNLHNFMFDVIVDGVVRCCDHQELLEEKDWGVDETR